MSGVNGNSMAGSGNLGRWWLRVWAAVALLDPRHTRRRRRRSRHEANAPTVVRSQRDFLYRRIDDDPAEDQPEYRDS